MAQAHNAAGASSDNPFATQPTTRQPYEMPYLYTMQSTYPPNLYNPNEAIFNNPWIPPDSYDTYVRTTTGQSSVPYNAQNDVPIQNSSHLTINSVSNAQVIDAPLNSPAFSASEEQQFHMLVPPYIHRSNSIASSAQSSTSSVGDAGADIYFSSNGSHPTTPMVENSPNVIAQPSSISTDQSPADSSKRPRRKRGRPRLVRVDADEQVSADSSKSANRISKRLPHTQVERKYREGLNAELERLRQAIPTLPKWDSNSFNAPPKPSKATVLASAIDYIHSIEAERDRLLEENSVLQGHLGRADTVKQGQQRQLEAYNGQAWTKPGQSRV